MYHRSTTSSWMELRSIGFSEPMPNVYMICGKSSYCFSFPGIEACWDIKEELNIVLRDIITRRWDAGTSSQARRTMEAAESMIYLSRQPMPASMGIIVLVIQHPESTREYTSSPG